MATIAFLRGRASSISASASVSTLTRNGEAVSTIRRERSIIYGHYGVPVSIEGDSVLVTSASPSGPNGISRAASTVRSTPLVIAVQVLPTVQTKICTSWRSDNNVVI